MMYSVLGAGQLHMKIQRGRRQQRVLQVPPLGLYHDLPPIVGKKEMKLNSTFHLFSLRQLLL